jgi:serine/threonine protein kinase
MDIKPTNLLVRDIQSSTIVKGERQHYKIYIADFGIARSYASAEEAITDSWTAFTKKYAAPEVLRQDKRGLSADIFSLGCVFAEMLAVISQHGHRLLDQRQRLLHARAKDQETHCSPTCGQPRMPVGLQLLHNNTQGWLCGLVFDGLFKQVDLAGLELEDVRRKVVLMVDCDPTVRPSAEHLATAWVASDSCCGQSIAPEPFENAIDN